MAISKVTPVATVIWPLLSISNDDALAPKRLYVSVSFASTSVAVTGAPTLSPASALSDTERAPVSEGGNTGASFTASIWMETEAVLERDGLPVSRTW